MTSKANSQISPAPSSTVLKWSLERPLLTGTVLYAIAVVIRLVDSIVLRLDERLGELILTKSLGFIMVVIFVWLAGRKLKDIGLHGRSLGRSLLIGALPTIIGFGFGYGVEILLAYQQGYTPRLSWGAIDSKMGVTGGMWFGLWLLFCNAVNSFMEEGFFRGVLGRLGRMRFSFWGTNWFQAAFFSAWHLPWVLKYYLVGDITTGGELATSILFHSLPQLLIGIVYGYFYLKTGSLWAAWTAHTISNSASNFLHVSTAAGLDEGLPIRMTINLVVMLLGLWWVRRQAGIHQMEEVKPWG